MKHLPRAAAFVLAFPALARAHPGHDGPHDLEWDFGHFASHPLATILCLAVLGAGVWAVWRSSRSKAQSRTAKQTDPGR